MDAGKLSAQFVLDLMLDENSLARDVMYINGGSACNYSSGYYIRNIGIVVEAFSVLSAVTGNSQWSDAYAPLVRGTVLRII
jgi:hypothetical protein